MNKALIMATMITARLPILVRDTFKAAQETGDLTFYQTQVSILQCSGLPFQVRFSPVLANKPKSNKPRNPNEKLVDPFSEPPKGLFVASLPTHNIVLNKFPVIPGHFILATKEFKEQTDLLEVGDLGAAYECLKAYRENGEGLFGFFNSGEHSGASQPHRHIQFLPVESMRVGIEAGQRWEVLAASFTNSKKPDLPFTYFASALPESPSPQTIHDAYILLYNHAFRIIYGSSTSCQPTDGHSSISYNLGLTDRVLVLCPRTSEGAKIKTSTGKEIGSVALNGTVLGGTLLVKSEAEWDALHNDDSKLKDILSAIGFPPSKVEHDEKL